MKRVLVLTIVNINNLEEQRLYHSLYKTLSKNVKIDILSVNNMESMKKIIGNATIYRVKSKSLFNINKISKMFNLLTLNKNFKNIIKKELINNQYDLILYSTPPITLNKTIKYAKKVFNAKTYLLLKDIFPQNAVDLNMFRKNGIIYRYFRKKENNLYNISDYIGLMSQGNLDFILNNNKINKNKLEINPNSIKIKNHVKLTKKEKEEILLKYELPLDKHLFIYGGNLGIPQGMDYILKVVKENEMTNNQIIIVGDGTEKNKLINYIKENEINNTTFIEKMPKKEYDQLLNACDVGLIFLDSRFTIPNIPSRLLSYLDYSKPVIAATDVNTDLKDIIIEGKFGFWCESREPKDMLKLFEKIKNNNLIQNLGINGRKYLENNYNVHNTANLILEKFKEE